MRGLIAAHDVEQKRMGFVPKAGVELSVEAYSDAFFNIITYAVPFLLSVLMLLWLLFVTFTFFY